MRDAIIILDYGSQYSQLIARRIREANVYCELFSWRTSADVIMRYEPKGFVLSGGPNSVYDESAPTLPDYVLKSGVPVLGICYGMQLLAYDLGGQVATSQRHEYGPALLHVDELLCPLFQGWQQEDSDDVRQVWMSHGDKVQSLPPGFIPLAHTNNSPLAASADLQRGYYAVQFHPEVVHTRQGRRILSNFVHLICGCGSDWTPANFIDEQVTAIRQQVGDDRVVLGLSGGVDSAVAGALIHRAIGDQLTCIFVDHGLLRQGEALQVVETFDREMGMHLVAINAIEEYLEALEDVTDPEQKRSIIGEKFIRIFEREARKLGEIDFLAQGTIYPDVIESAGAKTGKAHVIKSHHNVGGLPDDMALDLVEPLRELFKDEVRKIGLELGLPYDMVYRHPFPGPGLGVRILGEVKKEYADLLRLADAIFIEELHRDGWYQKTSQAFAVFLPVKSVGVVGDARRYEYVIALRAVETVDFMTARWAHLPYDLLERASNRIINEISGVSRVTYDVSSKPPATIEWE